MGDGARVSGTTALAGVLGDPVRHSLSPVMHNAALAALGLDWIYLALPVAAADLAAALRGLEALDCRGLNVTLPHKQAAAALAAELTPLARRLGAVNTLVRRPAGGPGGEGGGGWLGTNTDAEGFLAPLREARGETGWRGGRALVLGCGGSARAVLAGLAELGLERIEVAGRRPGALEAFVADCHPWTPGLAGLTWKNEGGASGSLGEALAACDLVVNTTPVGMAGAASGDADTETDTEACPLTETELDRLPAGATVYDLIYTPRPTPLLRRAAARGFAVLDGLEMLVQQGAASLRLWSGRADVPVDAMRQAALQELGRRQGSGATGPGYQAR